MLLLLLLLLLVVVVAVVVVVVVVVVAMPFITAGSRSPLSVSFCQIDHCRRRRRRRNMFGPVSQKEPPSPALHLNVILVSCM